MGATKRRIRHDDFVEVIAGKEKGKKGKVLKVLRGEERVIVEKVNLIKRHVRPGKLGQQSGIIEREGKLHISNVMVVCTRCDSPVRVSRQLSPEGRKVRVCKRCGEAIDKT